MKDRDELFCPVNVSVHISEYKNSISYSFSLELFTYSEVTIKSLSACLIFFFVVPGRLKLIPRMEYNYIMCSPADITVRRRGVFFNGLQISCGEARLSSHEKRWLPMFTSVDISAFEFGHCPILLRCFDMRCRWSKKTKPNKNIRYFVWEQVPLEFLN